MDDFSNSWQSDEFNQPCMMRPSDVLTDDELADYYDDDDGYTDAEADGDVFASIGWGTDEDYGYYG